MWPVAGSSPLASGLWLDPRALETSWLTTTSDVGGRPAGAEQLLRPWEVWAMPAAQKSQGTRPSRLEMEGRLRSVPDTR